MVCAALLDEESIYIYVYIYIYICSRSCRSSSPSSPAAPDCRRRSSPSSTIPPATARTQQSIGCCRRSGRWRRTRDGSSNSSGYLPKPTSPTQCRQSSHGGRMDPSAQPHRRDPADLRLGGSGHRVCQHRRGQRAAQRTELPLLSRRGGGESVRTAGAECAPAPATHSRLLRRRTVCYSATTTRGKRKLRRSAQFCFNVGQGAAVVLFFTSGIPEAKVHMAICGTMCTGIRRLRLSKQPGANPCGIATSLGIMAARDGYV